MPVKFQFDEKKRYLHGSIEGVVSICELGDALKAIALSESFPADVNALWDCRNLDFSALDSNFGYELAQLRAAFPQKSGAMLAIVVSTERGFGLSRMYELLSSDLPQTIMVFRDYKDAEEWLMNGGSKGDES